MLASIALALVQAWATQRPLDSSVAAADSVRIIRSVRSAQAAFESFRRSRLPTGHEFSGPCEIHIGRYCYWRGDEGEEAPPPEAHDVRERRDALIASLDSAAGRLRGDAWIAGQYVRYLVEADRGADASRFARSACRAESSWCAALDGFAAHATGSFAEADSAFRSALATMSLPERCRWLDISSTLNDELERRFTDVGCEGRETFVRRLLWLGSPLYSVSESDLFTEHVTRLTRARIVERSATPDGEHWADDTRELVTRYGWPRWYSRSVPPYGSQIRPSITGHDAGLPYDFLPSLRALDDVGQMTRDDWHLDDTRARTGYAPAYARTVHEIPGQLAVFRRGDSALVVAAWDVRRDTTLLGRPLAAALVLADERRIQAIARQDSAKTVGHIMAIAPLDAGLVSLELLAREDRRAARVRKGIPAKPAGRVVVSDLLLYSWSSESAIGPEAFRDSALASPAISGARAVGVYWETYGLRSSGEPVDFGLTVEPIGVGWMRRAAERLHLTDPTSGLRVQWQEVPQTRNGLAGRAVRLDLSRLRAGRYRVRLTVSAAGEAPATTTHEIEIR